MQSRNSYFKDILKIAGPIILGNIGFIMIGVGDVIVAGRHSTETLAAISISNAITSCIMMFGIGLLVSVSAILSNYRGAGKDITQYFYPSLKFSMYLSCLIALLIFACIPIVGMLGYSSNLTFIIKEYLFITAFATFGAYMHCMAKEYLQAFEIVVFPNILSIFCIFLNLLLNIIFVFGYGKIPPMGAIGLAISSLFVRYFMGITLIAYCYLRKKVSGSIKQKRSDPRYYKDLIKVGFPASIAIMVEFTAFNIIAIIMGMVAEIYAAAHTLLCTLTSVSFMVPLAISNAVAVKVGFSNGSHNYDALKKYAFTGIKTNVIFMACSAVLLGCFANFWVSLFTQDNSLIKICIPIIYILSCFQVFDGLQVTLSGIFRGIKQTKIVMVSNFISYWLIAFPLGCILAFYFKFNLIGFWIAISISSFILCSIMFITLMKKFNEHKQIIT